jgi:hypothetical protein
VIPQLSFPDPTTASNIIATATQYGLVDWWVDEGCSADPKPTFNVASRTKHGRDWRARVGPSGLQETGPQVDHMYSGVVVPYNDPAGPTRTVRIDDTDPTNPVVGVIDRPFLMPSIGTNTDVGATVIGQRFLEENRERNTAGQASIVGHVQDASGAWWPAWMIRAGDRITFVDSHDPVARRITRAQYTDSSRTCQIDLDSPPQDISQFLARVAAGLVGTGV